MRAQIEKKMAQKEKDKKEEALRQLAQRARDESSGISRNRGLYRDVGYSATKYYYSPDNKTYIFICIQGYYI